MIIAITGATGNMGREVMKELLSIDSVVSIRMLSRNPKRLKQLVKLLEKHLKSIGGDLRALDKITPVSGSLTDERSCARLADGADYVLAIGAVIPPQSDIDPRAAVEANEHGTNALVSAIEKLEKQPKLVHVSTVAVYGNRNSRHPWGRVGDPLVLSVLDIYSTTKMRGEFRVMNSAIKDWVVLRQSAMLHDNMLSGSLSDGLMFHTCFNAPLEWVTAQDSGVLIRRIIERDCAGELDRMNFWNKCFNIGGGARNRLTGYDTLNDGFKMIGGTAKDFFRPNYNATRNFHGVWFADGDKLDKLFGYISQDATAYWNKIADMHPLYALGRAVPKTLIARFTIKRLFKNYNSPAYWYKNDDSAKLTAFFGGRAAYERLPANWDDFPLLRENKDEWGNPIDFERLRSNPIGLNYGFDFDKPDDEIDLNDLKNVAEAHGGRLVSDGFAAGDMHAKQIWETQDDERFEATPYCVLRGGHWYNISYRENVWDFDRLAKRDKIFAQLWSDSHGRDECVRYGLDANFRAYMEEIE